MSIPLYFVKQLKNGKWRLYKIVGQALMSWRGDNDKTTTVRDDYGRILNFNNREEAENYCQKIFGTKPLDEKDVES